MKKQTTLLILQVSSSYLKIITSVPPQMKGLLICKKLWQLMAALKTGNLNMGLP